jgi:hypothetical protein
MIQIIDCEQGSEEWFRARAGIPTASCFADILTKGRGSQPSKVRMTYMLKLAGEIVTGDLTEQATSRDLERGHVMEEEARDYYALSANCEPKQVGFIRNGQMGSSPDSLIGNSGMLEIKTAKPHVVGAFMLSDEFPDEHKAQCQGNLLVAEREWIDLIVYWPKMPRFIMRAYRDEEYLKTLTGEINKFNDELSAVVSRIRSFGLQEAA